MTGSDYETIVYSKKDRIARVIFSRPEVHNAFNTQMIGEIDDAFDKIVSDESARVVILDRSRKVLLRRSGYQLDAGDHPLFL